MEVEVEGERVGVGAVCKVGPYSEKGGASDPTVFVYPQSNRYCPPMDIAADMIRRGYLFNLNRSRVFSPYELGTGAHGFYGSKHFLALFKSGGLFRKGRRVVSLEDMEYVLKGYDNKENLISQMVKSGLQCRRAGVGPKEGIGSGGRRLEGGVDGGGRKRRRGGMLSTLHSTLQQLHANTFQ